MQIIKNVAKNSLADLAGIKALDTIVKINGRPFCDVLDLIYQSSQEEVVIELSDRVVTIENKNYENLGLEFETYLIDKEKFCKNKCIFCFVDQLPSNMRKTLNFKDDDYRLSFLHGNYVTLTNLSDDDMDRIIDYKISPLNISVHSTDNKLRRYILGNNNAESIIKILKKLTAAGINIRCQIVVTPGINDGKHLEKTLLDLFKLYPYVSSVSIVPVGLTKHREKLMKLSEINEQSAIKIIEIVTKFYQKSVLKHTVGFCYPADELFIKAGYDIPPFEYYDDFEQLENGVGLIAKFREEFYTAAKGFAFSDFGRKISVVTGEDSYIFLKELLDYIKNSWHNFDYKLHKIKNDFFGNSVTVSGLITASDIIAQLRGIELYNELLIPDVMLRANEEVFLDNLSISDVEKELNVSIAVVDVNGESFFDLICNTQEGKK